VRRKSYSCACLRAICNKQHVAGRGRAFVVDRFSPENTFDRYLELYGVTP